MSDQSSDRKNLEDRLSELRGQIRDLRKKLETAVGAEAEALRPKLEEAQSKLRELKGMSAEAWDDLKPGLRNAWEELQKSLKQAASRFKARPGE